MTATSVQGGVAVGIGEVRTASAGDPPLLAFGLGSCVGVIAYDPAAKVGGMAHVMLPDDPPNGATGQASMPARYANPGLRQLTDDIEALGGNRRRLVFKLVGGAQVLSVPGAEDRFNIGRRNIAAIRQHLEAAGHRIAGADVGGHKGRTVRFDVSTGVLTVRQVGDTTEREL